jgi:hypothetical protein
VVDLVLLVGDPGVNRHPLDPGLEIGGGRVGLGREDLRLVVKALEIGELARRDELLHQYRRQLVELEQDHLHRAGQYRNGGIRNRE